jgi:hypothetical protein
MNEDEEPKVYRSYPAKWGILFTGINTIILCDVIIVPCCDTITN